MKLNTAMIGSVVIGGVIAVVAAGFLMYQLRDVEFIKQARSGFDTGLL